MRKFLTTGRRRYALPSLVIGILALTACVPEDVQAPFLNVKSHDFGSVPLGSSSAPFQFTVTNPLVGFSHVSLHTSVGEPFSVINDTCRGRPLGRGDTCTFEVIYTPDELGP